jgi:hypothetical protein
VNRPSPVQIHAAVAAARQAIKNQSQFYSSMISDDDLQAVVVAGLIAAFNVQPKDTK